MTTSHATSKTATSFTVLIAVLASPRFPNNRLNPLMGLSLVSLGRIGSAEMTQPTWTT